MTTPDLDHYTISDEAQYVYEPSNFVLRHTTPITPDHRACYLHSLDVNDFTITELLRTITEHDADCPLGRTNPSKEEPLTDNNSKEGNEGT